jgi:sialidase-1
VRLLDSLCYQYGHYDGITTAQILSGWTYVASWKPTGSAGTRDGFVNVPALEATASGAKVTFDFTGTAVGIVSPEGPDVGKIDFTIDGTRSGTLDQFTNWSSGLHIPWIWMFATDLANTRHSLTCTIAATKNGASTGYASRIFQFAVNGQ